MSVIIKFVNVLTCASIPQMSNLNFGFLICLFVNVNLLAQNESRIEHIDTPSETDTSAVYSVTQVDSQPDFEYVSGQNTAERLDNFIKSNLQLTKQDCNGMVFVKVVIERDGRLSNHEITRGLGDACNNEALRVVKMIQRFKPARLGRNVVRSWYLIPVKYQAKN